VSFADAADRRVAAHLSQGREVLCDEKRTGTRSRGSERRFRSGVAAADYNDFESAVHGADQILRNARPAILMRGADRRQNALLNFIQSGR
jgi:hypothetical protein